MGYWRFDQLEEVLKDDNVPHLQVLIHEANWTESVMSPRKRFAKAKRDRVDCIIEGQVKGLNRKGHLCPDNTKE